ncbi:putative fatty-acid--CoA ligase FadD10 [Quaeritorhiza haematococci]|nr:putative fatty-acid--CoA ligase FadD10 [Quaeritorhiza haematococci]
MNPTYTIEEVAYQLKDSRARFFFVHPSLISKALEAASEVGIPTSKIFVLGDETVEVPLKDKDSASTPLRVLSVGDLLVSSESSTEELLETVTFTTEELKTNPAYLCYSSGTTGLNKGVVTSHRNMAANVLQLYALEGETYVAGKDVWMAVLPFFHIYGLNLLLHTALFAGVAIVIMPRFDLIQFIENIIKYKATFAHIVPPIAIALAKHPVIAKYMGPPTLDGKPVERKEGDGRASFMLKKMNANETTAILRLPLLEFLSLRCFLSGAAPLGPEISKLLVERLHIPIKQGYGMTELSPVAIYCPAKIVDGSCGVLIPNQEAKLVDTETEKEIEEIFDENGLSQSGELWIRGPNVMVGYLHNEQATRNTITEDGWCRTGDIARVDKDGYFYIVDRLKELIKYKGYQVPPAELESLILNHPSVADVAVIGKPDEEAGEVPLAFVVLKKQEAGKQEDWEDLQECAREIQEYVGKHVAPYKRLRGGVRFVEVIPKSPSGKILRRVLRVEILEEE